MECRKTGMAGSRKVSGEFIRTDGRQFWKLRNNLIIERIMVEVVTNCVHRMKDRGTKGVSKAEKIGGL